MFPYDLVGVYRLTGLAAVTYKRLTLELSGRALYEGYMDFGGYWYTEVATTWWATESRICFPDDRKVRRQRWLPAGLHVRRSDGPIGLVPEQELASTTHYNIFFKLPLPWAGVCIDSDRFGHALTAGRAYMILEENPTTGRVRIRGDHNRLRWFPRACFRG